MLNKSGFTWDPTKKMIQCEKQQYETHCKNNPDAKGLYGVSFPYYDELSVVYSKDMATSEGAEDMTDAVKNLEEDLVCVNANDEEVATMSIGKMAQAMDREASNQEKARDEDPQQKLREKAINEVRRLEFTGSEVIKAAAVFVRMPDQMGMLFALPEPLRREYIVDMLRDEAARREREVEVKVKVLVLLWNDGALKVVVGLVGLKLFSFSVLHMLLLNDAFNVVC
ncbi:hypothetical protein Zm00014a_012638 [Zea mays]|uniref:MLLE-like domain-containing protein n=1 Tax=Zea mays TaxID=4577 RepID=A0A3L6FYT3_MAIZE|nr:hypothetical protein Zm00014a_012638 [Zea mays]PWZ39710.1 hypothetical protein Zm00014a_012638 [Zea mays]PWZ39711.1 hypothetical protein Zm00014a_012638 [Zea mays]PWZ39712.1 hypothetical protein Zm00014a_012638 [Zea mays]PWZ39713.1 hypothetical protein Zm00014a_012638 [Zea mays]